LLLLLTFQVLGLGASLQIGASAFFELYSPPLTPSVRLTLDACFGFTSLYVCSPGSASDGASSPRDSAPGCRLDPEHPGPSNYTYASSSFPSGRVDVALDSENPSFSSLYFAVRADAGSSHAPKGAAVQYHVTLSAGDAAYLTLPPNITATSRKGITTLSWLPAYATGGAVSPSFVVGAMYSVYIAPGSFRGSASGLVDFEVITSTPCGLAAWQAAVPEGVVFSTANTSAELRALDPGAAFEAAVVAECSAGCWSASGVAQGRQLAATAVVAFTTAGSPSPRAAGSQPAANPVLPVAGVVGIVVSVAFAVACCAGVWRHRASRTTAAASQYTNLDIAAALAVKVGAGDEQEGGGSASAQTGGSVASRLRELFHGMVC
jgi:hypothetical protein